MTTTKTNESDFEDNYGVQIILINIFMLFIPIFLIIFGIFIIFQTPIDTLNPNFLIFVGGGYLVGGMIILQIIIENYMKERKTK